MARSFVSQQHLIMPGFAPEAVKLWRADAQVQLIGRLQSCTPVFGALVSRTGIARSATPALKIIGCFDRSGAFDVPCRHRIGSPKQTRGRTMATGSNALASCWAWPQMMAGNKGRDATL
jgi:hypothetical protein